MPIHPPRIAFLGLGAMGQRMAARLLAAGAHVTVWNRGRGPAAQLGMLGASFAPTPAHAAQDADIVISMVYGEEASRFVWLDPESGAALGLGREAVAVECSTLGAAWIEELASALPVPLVDAPVVGSRAQAQEGLLIFLAGGDAAVIERLRPTLLLMGREVQRAGPSGAGCAIKLAANSLFGIQVVAIAEQLRLLADAGIDLDAALAILSNLPVSSPAAINAGRLILGNQHAPQAPVDLICKDLGYALVMSRSELPLTTLAAHRYLAASAAGHGQENLTAVAKLYGSLGG